jgi:hypothetical protein
MEHNTGTVGAASPGTSVTTGAAAGTKGTAVQLIASTSFDAYWVTVLAHSYSNSATASQGCLDILTGAATEEVLIPNLLMGYCGWFAPASTTCGPKRWDFPLYIPAGTRLAAQAAGARVSTAMRVAIFLYGGDGYPAFRIGSKVVTYGVTVPNGTTVTPGATGAEGAWTQITASTTEDHFALVPSWQVSGATVVNLRTLAVDIGLGAATEEEIAQSYWFSTDALEAMNGPHNSMPCFQDIPSGTRLTIRASNSGANDATYNAAIHGVS